MEHTLTDQQFACEECGFTSPLTNDICPNCSGRMVALDAPVKQKSAEGDEAGEDAELSTESEEGGAISLESLQEQESKDDNEDDYGDGE